jgi:hypothetical protein
VKRQRKNWTSENLLDRWKCGKSAEIGLFWQTIKCANDAEELNLNRETVRKILTEDLGMRKVSAKMVLWIC